MKLDRDTLIAELENMIKEGLDFVDSIKLKDLSQLNKKPDQNSWSILECLEHLNLYGDFYIPEISKQLNKNKSSSNPDFKTGVMGHKFTQMMLPKPGMKTMKTFKDKNPSLVYKSQLGLDVLDRFVKQQEAFLKILEKSKKIDLKKTKTAISISKIMKLRLGDTLRFVIYHQVRHIEQAKRAMAKTS